MTHAIQVPPTQTIRITKEVVALAVPSHKGQCLIAIAIRLQFPGVTSIDIADRRVRFNLDGWRYSYPMPAKAARLVEEFDALNGVGREKFVGFWFRLDYRPDASMAHVQIRGPRANRRRPNKKRKAGVAWSSCKRRYHGVSGVRAPKVSA